MKKVVVLTGAGVSAESGIRTFRDNGGLWEEHRVEDIATPNAWHKDPELVLRFYNERRNQMYTVEPNDAHRLLAKLEDHFDVVIITQNVDNLHEKGGSTKVVHLHGELSKARSSSDADLIQQIDGQEIKMGDLAEDGTQLRPHIVWFGEMVPMMEEAIGIASEADIFIVVGTSLLVYPAAGLINYVRPEVPIYLIDPVKPTLSLGREIHYIGNNATIGTKLLYDVLLSIK
jgi:NAD-dependent deacetylase